ncbi:MAG: electron transfer flavoprotein subunit alpha/FixB family protein [Flavobacteriaceae bacterium]|nr:electron transfer flavoprotein subunit alpha/FixB family protein [Flavobacteriaceae bacterium]
MSVLIIADSSEGIFKKVAFELVSYGKKVAELLGTNTVALTINAADNDQLFKYGAEKVLCVSNDALKDFNAKSYAAVIQQAAEAVDATVVLIDSGNNGLYMGPMVAVNLNAGYTTNVVSLPNLDNGFIVKRNAFSTKAYNHTSITTDIKVIALAKNSYGIVENEVAGVVEDFNPTIAETTLSVSAVEKITGKVTIGDAEIVVSGGRGLKGPENWGMIEELAQVLGAATACSKPVSDLGWRPHSEHVGQTGKPVAANLYIAIGISGAIQHLAGINASKVKVVINTDPEAPFFKAADYGIVGDAFEVVPKLIEKLKEFKAQNA